MYAEENHYNHVSDDDSGCWMYIVSIFIPFIGIILGLTYIAKNEDELGKSLIIFSIISNVIMYFLYLLFF